MAYRYKPMRGHITPDTADGAKRDFKGAGTYLCPCCQKESEFWITAYDDVWDENAETPEQKINLILNPKEEGQGEGGARSSAPPTAAENPFPDEEDDLPF